MSTSAQQRYEALYRAVGRTARNSLFVCWGLTIVLAFVFGLAATLLTLGPMADWSDWLRFAVIAVPAVLIIGIVPGLAQLWVLGSDTRRAFEAFNAINLLEQRAYARVAGHKPPRVLTAGQVRRWLETGEGAGTPLRARLLLFAGDVDAADAPSLHCLQTIPRTLCSGSS